MAILPFGTGGKNRETNRADRSAVVLDQRIRAAFDLAPVGLAVATLDGHWLLFNDTCCSLLGYRREELVHSSLNDITHPEDAQEELVLIRQLLAGDAQRYRIDKRTIDKGGTYRVHRVTAVLVRSAGSEPDVFVFAIESPQARAETGHDADRFAAAILQSLTDTAVIRTDPAGTITGWNLGAERILGYKRDEILGRHRRHLFRDQDNWEDKPVIHLRLAREQGRYLCTDWRLRHDGSHVWLKSTIAPFSPDGTVRGYVETLTASDNDSIDSSSALEHLRAQLKAERVTTQSLQERFEQMNTRAVTRSREIQVLSTELRTEVERRKKAELELESLPDLQTASHPAPPEAPSQPSVPWLAPAVEIGIDEAPTQWVALEGHAPIRLVIDAAGSLRTGALIVACGRAHKAMFFREGRLCCVASDSLDDQLGERLVTQGLISDEQRLEALEFSDKTNLAFGRSLMALGFLDFDQVTEAIRAKIEAEIEDFASWSDCHWVFVEREPPQIKLIQLSVDVHELRAVRAVAPPVAPPDEEFAASPKIAKGRKVGTVRKAPKVRKPTVRYLATTNGSRYHRQGCTLLARAKSTLIEITSQGEAKNKNLEPCQRCV